LRSALERILAGAASLLWLRRGTPLIRENNVPLSMRCHRISVQPAEAFFFDELVECAGKTSWLFELEEPDRLYILISPKDQLFFFFPLDLCLPDRNGYKKPDTQDRNCKYEDEQSVTLLSLTHVALPSASE
jgi:hypothetical protein